MPSTQCNPQHEQQPQCGDKVCAPYVVRMHMVSSLTEYGSIGHGCQSCSWSAKQEVICFPLPPFAPENLVSRHASAYSCSTLRLNLMLTHGIRPAFRDGVHEYRQPPSGQSRAYRVTQWHNDGVICREPTGTESVVLNVVRVTGTAFSGFTMNQFLCASIFP